MKNNYFSWSVITAIILLCLTSCSAFTGWGVNSSAESSSSSSSEELSSSHNSHPQESSVPVSSQPESSDITSSKPEDSEASPQQNPVTILKLVIPEGYTLAKIGMTLEDMGICTVEDFITATQNFDTAAFPIVNAPKPDTNRCFKLEGYLYPDTYEIYSNESPESIISRMLTHFENTIAGDIKSQIDNSGYTVDEIIALASIIEKEAFGHDVMPAISSVIHNRLNSGTKIECDVTITYVEGALKPFITGDINRYNADYNTFKCPALPAGAICNPSIDAIKAALNPLDTEYFFFLTDKDKNYYFTADYNEHLENVAKYVKNS